ncbi:MAG: hypothetical protein H7328_07865 [Bdellovibrio sp.]|nr:hypothetical protein [Bdellovibrio sp.]
MKTLFTIFCLLYIPWTVEAAPVVKKNVCTITINSSEEAELFKSNLSPNLWNFIELAPKNAEAASKDWFSQSCKPSVKCDILVVSGHFGGTFFGESKLTLSMEDLEKNSCDDKCSGILKQPREVFLFGCNTLASKQKDHRTPEQYMQVLLNDGFSTAQASQIVSFRYSGFGDSFKYSMSQVFAATPRIYGFSSVGPSGKTVEPLLRNYLKSSQAQYANFEAYDKEAGTKTNSRLFTALKNTSLAQAYGLNLAMKNAEEKPYCYIRSEKISRLDKLKYIKKLFEAKKAVQLLAHIQDFLHSVRLAEKPLNEEEKKVWLAFSTDPKLKNDLLDLLKLNGDIYLPLKANILNTLKDLDLIDEQFVASSFNQMVDLRTPFTETRRSMLCSLQLTINIPFEAIQPQRWTEPEFISTLLCLRPTEPRILEKMASLVKTGVSANLRGTAIWYFYWFKTDDVSIQKNIAEAILSEKDDSVRQTAAMVLKTLKPTSVQIKAILSQAIQQEKNSHIIADLQAMLN